MGRNYTSMRTVYTSDGLQVGMAIAQPSETPQRSVVGGWGCELKCEGEGEGRWGWAGKLKEASILSKLVYTLCIGEYLFSMCVLCVCVYHIDIRIERTFNIRPYKQCEAPLKK